MTPRPDRQGGGHGRHDALGTPGRHGAGAAVRVPRPHDPPDDQPRRRAPAAHGAGGVRPVGAGPDAAVRGRRAEGVAAAPDHPGPVHARRAGRLTPPGAPEDQASRSSPSSTRTPNRSESAGTRSSTPWKSAVKSRSAGSRSGANPYPAMPSRASDLLSVPAES